MVRVTLIIFYNKHFDKVRAEIKKMMITIKNKIKMNIDEAPEVKNS